MDKENGRGGISVPGIYSKVKLCDGSFLCYVIGFVTTACGVNIVRFVIGTVTIACGVSMVSFFLAEIAVAISK